MPKTNENAPPEFIFVGGTALKGRTGVIRSSVVRRALSDRRAKKHQDASQKLESMLKRPESSICTCQRARSGSADSPSTASAPAGPSYRAIRPKKSTSSEKASYFCTMCGKSLPPPSAPVRALVPVPETPPPRSFVPGNRDPAIPTDPALVGVNVHGVLNFAATAIWSSFRLSHQHVPSCYQTWIFPYNDKLKIYTTLWSSVYHQDMLRLSAGATTSGEVDSREQLYLRGLVLSSLREEVSKPLHLSSADGLVMSVLFLAVNVAHRIGLRRDPNPFNPPFTELHGLHNYGSRQYHPWHWDIVHKIIHMFGGISSLKAHGLAWLLSIADIMNAVNTLQKPMYPMLDVAGNVLNFDPPLTLFPVKRWSEEEYAYPPGSAFLELLFFSPPVNDELVTYFVHLGQLSTVIEYYSRHPELCTSTLLDILGDSRNLVHHRLFSLPDDSDDISLYILPSSPEPDPSHLEFTREMYHICRLSALLYSIHVTFPTPRIAPQQRQLATALHSKLQALADREGGTSNPLLLWPILILTISYGIGSPHAMEWLPLLKKLCLELRLDSRGSLLKYLRSFAWVDSAYPETNGDVLSQIICS